jgi:hypothetical protein
MKFRLLTAFIPPCILVSTLLALCGADSTAGKQLCKSTQLIMSDDPKDWRLAAEEAARERKLATSVLKEIIGRPISVDSRPKIAQAMKIAAILRDSDLVEVLFDKIDYSEEEYPAASKPADRVDDFLAVQTLIAIGDTAIDPALRRLATERERDHQLLEATVVTGVLGNQCATLRFQNERKRIVEAGGDPIAFDTALLVCKSK